jgi:putative addiction module antidote
MTRVKIRKIGNSLGVILPKEILDALGAREGDVVSFARGASGLVMSVSDEGSERLLEAAERIV